MNINMNAIMGKAKAWSQTEDGKRRMAACVEKYRKDGRKATSAGSKIVTEDMMREAANKFIEVMKETAVKEEYGLPDSVIFHINNMHAGEPVETDDSYCISVHFGGNLHREALENDEGYNGVDNIVALFNNGSPEDGHTPAFIYGWWNNHKPTGEALSRSMPNDNFAWVRSRREREALNFIQKAVTEFNEKYGSKYNVTAVEGAQYRPGYDWPDTK